MAGRELAGIRGRAQGGQVVELAGRAHHLLGGAQAQAQPLGHVVAEARGSEPHQLVRVIEAGEAPSDLALERGARQRDALQAAIEDERGPQEVELAQLLAAALAHRPGVDETLPGPEIRAGVHGWNDHDAWRLAQPN